MTVWEGMPRVVLEAMASRLPVVATGAEGVAELLGPAAASQTVPYGDSQALAAKILALLADPAKAAQLGAANRARYVVETYQETPSVVDGLQIMVRAYRELGLGELAEDTLAVLALN